MTNIQNQTQSIYKFQVVGIITSEDFQKIKYAVNKLHKSFPKDFDVPEVRPMLDVEWTEFITKYRRRLGNGLWSIQNRVVVFQNGEFLGDFREFNEFIWKKWNYVYNQDWHELATLHLIDYLEEKIAQYRQLIYFTIAINSRVIGSLLFELYNDIVPLTCENFANRCINKTKGYIGSPIHRIVPNSWIQCGGYELTPIKIPCENYVVPHDRRGVLSMCNNGLHKDNSTQFYIALESAPWMNYKYVAFGQLIQGENVLQAIENEPTYYQAPIKDIRIVKCGEYQTRPQASSSEVLFTADEIEQWKDIQQQIDILTYLKSHCQVTPGEQQTAQVATDFLPLKHIDSYDSLVSAPKIKMGTYSLKTDTKSYGPFSHLPYQESQDDEGAEDFDICGPDYPIRRFKMKLYDDNDTPSTSDITI